jgi:predicted nucleic acid-binding protein
MTPAFADSFYFIAILNASDASHQRAEEFATDTSIQIITTDFVLLEVLDAFCATGREQAQELVNALRSEQRCSVIPADRKLFDKGLALYRNRSDKDWSLTDCVSFVVMKERRIRGALTADKHFTQAGFKALLK